MCNRRSHVRIAELGQDRTVRRTPPVNARCSAGVRPPRPAPGSMPNSRQASISLEPLVHQRRRVDRDLAAHPPACGCAQACVGRMPRPCCSRGDARNGPPDAVSIDPAHSRRASGPSSGAPGMHWKIALCSLSIGMSVAPLAARRGHRATGLPPPATSLFASSTRLPARGRGERRQAVPAAPTIAAMTVSTRRRCAATSTSASSPGRDAGRTSGTAVTADRAREPLPDHCMTASVGRCATHLLEQAADDCAPPRARRLRKRSGCTARRRPAC